ncbi:SDR family NAD(P)-dependent oxidoreductase [Pseudonocardia sp. CA-107938]|uniref:SDR family NAD(P)-dependent oxidoreductase n=1 Tax=Pseudonocardia sp. CA-107938 TaxID=3240021 RepID=UPI003D8BD9F1
MTRTVAVIGATAGLGREAAHRLAAAGHRVIAVGRDPQKAAGLRRDLPGITVITGDVSTADGVARVAGHVRNHTDHLDTLVNNAGVMPNRRQVTADGAELNFAVHHLAPFSLTGSLLPLLQAGDGRVVNVNSAGHAAPMRGTGPVELQFDDLQHERDYDPFMAYSRSKLANLLFTYELARRHPELTVVALHPGVVRTSLGRDFPRPLVIAVHAFALSAARGAEPVVELATAAQVRNGSYYDRFAPVSSSRASYDRDAARRLWAATEDMRGPFARHHP